MAGESNSDNNGVKKKPNIGEKIKKYKEQSETSVFRDARPIHTPFKEYQPNGYHLKFMQVITRHGRRTPESTRYPLEMWSCNNIENLISDHTEKPTCAKGQLTVFGTKDLINVGRAYHTLLIDRLQFLSPQYTPSEIYIRSSDRERTISSARSLMHGLYGGSFAESNERSPRSSTFEIRPEPIENMYPRGSCQRFSFLKSLLPKHPVVLNDQKKSELAKFNQRVQAIFDDAKDDDAPFYLQGWRSYAGLVNSFDCFKNHGLPLPRGFTQQVVERMYLEAAKEYKSMGLFPDMSVLGIGRFVGDLSRQMFAKANNEKSVHPLKFALYSAHDSTLASLLVAFKMYDDNKHPETASTLEFLLYEKESEKVEKEKEKKTVVGSKDDDKQFVKIIYNQKVLHMEDCNDQEVDNMCPLGRFREICDSLIPTNYTEQCKITDEEKKRFNVAIQNAKL
ncbi:histidine acid phosphatase family protein [Cavenderia fasciculata]|uniref:Histidine acid phosphatase family protein n=1 Tax=Cavenderia fasciculata TaxID=261658 RepID=F4PQC0_CACFS|nr:histidine acid phosphatase family protein [Cavenderia fasciculata]EGG22583.1 histidine acid phosphatase family protein [Cavenderia fasciculata]|eukprot:XP_004360434.1 histidine acid phosphatase family protein [Cavenderia fasciculata]